MITTVNKANRDRSRAAFVLFPPEVTRGRAPDLQFFPPPPAEMFHRAGGNFTLSLLERLVHKCHRLACLPLSLYFTFRENHTQKNKRVSVLPISVPSPVHHTALSCAE